MEDQKYRDEEDLAEKLDSFKSKSHNVTENVADVLRGYRACVEHACTVHVTLCLWKSSECVWGEAFCAGLLQECLLG